MKSETYNTDCLQYMRTLPDNHFDLAIADPPYGIGCDGQWGLAVRAKLSSYKQKQWDRQPPTRDWFNELVRVSKNQIIFGANHFISRIPIDSPCWVVWDKENSGNFADCELAWTSFQSAVRIFRFRWNGMLQGNMANKEHRIHPTQKPVALYAWLLRNYAKEGDTIFDPMMGSQSSRIAAYKLGYDYTGCELDAEYYRQGCERFERECKGTVKGENGVFVTQLSMFQCVEEKNV